MRCFTLVLTVVALAAGCSDGGGPMGFDDPTDGPLATGPALFGHGPGGGYAVGSSAFAASRLGIEASGTVAIRDLPGGVMAGELVHVGRGCPAGTARPTDDPYLATPAGKIALIERGDCSFTRKLRRAQQEGAVGVIFYQSTAGGEDMTRPLVSANALDGSADVPVTIPAVLVQRSTGLLLRDAAAPTTVSVGPVTRVIPNVSTELLDDPGARLPEADPVINVTGKGNRRLAVTVWGGVATDPYDIQTIDVGTVELILLGNAVPVARRNDGSPMAAYEDVNGDGLEDLLLHFELSALLGPVVHLIEAQGLEGAQVQVAGLFANGGHLLGWDRVRFVP